MFRPAIAVMFLVCAGPAIAQEDAGAAKGPVIVASGEAVVRLAPDRAFVTLAADVLAPSPAEAQQKNAQAASAVRQRLKALEVPDEAIRTVSYSLNEEFEFANNKRISRGFRAVNQIEIRVDDLARVGEVVDAAVQAGAATVSDIRFDVKDRSTAERQALKEAVGDARARAEAMAAGAGVTLGGIQRIDEQGRAVPLPRQVMPMAGRVAAMAQADTPVTAGEIEVRAHVTITVAIK